MHNELILQRHAQTVQSDFILLICDHRAAGMCRVYAHYWCMWSLEGVKDTSQIQNSMRRCQMCFVETTHICGPRNGFNIVMKCFAVKSVMGFIVYALF